MQHTLLKQFHFRATLLAIAALFLAFPSYSQRNLKVGEEIKAPSTDAWNFIKYGEVGASLHTGTVNLSIPVYTYQDNDFSIPISLNYSSNGLVANMRAGILGPDWVLDAGGRISVEINGMFDFESYNTINEKTTTSTTSFPILLQRATTGATPALQMPTLNLEPLPQR